MYHISNTRKDILYLFFLVTIISVPFLNKPFHIDDTLFLYTASHIIKAPLRPYDFNINWYWTRQSMWSATQNPPMNSYFQAFLICFAGRSEVSMHLFYMLFSFMSVLFFYLICKEHLKHPLLPTLLFTVTPAFWLASNNVMADVPLLMFFMGGIYFFKEAQKRNSLLFYISSGIFMGLCGLTKYVGVSIIPLLLFYSISTNRKISKEVWVFCIPLAFFALWWAHGIVFYGKPHFLSATQYSLFNQLFKNETLTQLASTMIFLGGCSLFPILLAPVFDLYSNNRTRCLLYWFISSVIGVLALVFLLDKNTAFPKTDILLFLGFLIPTIRLMLWTIENSRSYFRLEHVVYLLWFSGMLVFCIFFNWTVASRVVLPAIPAWIFILFFIAERKYKTIVSRVTKTGILLTCIIAVISALLATSDLKFAEAYKSFAKISSDIYGPYATETVFTGHWGFQYYMEEKAFSPFQIDSKRMPRFIIQPEIANYAPMPKNAHKYYRPVKDISYFNPLKIHLMDDRRNAGFYGNSFGLLPFTFSKDPIQIFRVYERR